MRRAFYPLQEGLQGPGGLNRRGEIVGTLVRPEQRMSRAGQIDRHLRQIDRLAQGRKTILAERRLADLGVELPAVAREAHRHRPSLAARIRKRRGKREGQRPSFARAVSYPQQVSNVVIRLRRGLCSGHGGVLAAKILAGRGFSLAKIGSEGLGQLGFAGRLVVVDQHDPGVRRQSCSVKTILGLAFAILLAIRPLLVAAVAQW
ncbi:hypothetical protein CC_2351 [Caulobacter vibrioides CB15]|uniref:Uncharacterized protein n=1 Tax=Caulobacter vibrioides (strain ATCC 19089 / CIP 103742 / CB 15) TaxID=190650 RepID=Q9A5U6_CAUVC|nr:hypothetical protein CC_2351 [Caulobacter vibrioides CB15]